MPLRSRVASINMRLKAFPNTPEWSCVVLAKEGIPITGGILEGQFRREAERFYTGFIWNYLNFNPSGD